MIVSKVLGGAAAALVSVGLVVGAAGCQQSKDDAAWSQKQAAWSAEQVETVRTQTVPVPGPTVVQVKKTTEKVQVKVPVTKTVTRTVTATATVTKQVKVPVKVQPQKPVIMEDDPRWNCLTMGNRVCGPEWKPVTQELADALAEGEEAGESRDWESCKVKFGDTTYVVCPDGLVIES